MQHSETSSVIVAQHVLREAPCVCVVTGAVGEFPLCEPAGQVSTLLFCRPWCRGAEAKEGLQGLGAEPCLTHRRRVTFLSSQLARFFPTPQSCSQPPGQPLIQTRHLHLLLSQRAAQRSSTPHREGGQASHTDSSGHTFSHMHPQIFSFTPVLLNINHFCYYFCVCWTS